MARVIAGRYALEAEIGRGGMGAVWRASDQVLGRTVALKKIGVAPGGFTPDALRAEREARLAARLSHANVVSVFDLASDAAEGGLNQQWLVMEYVDGIDLSALIKERGSLTPDQVAPILAQTAAALAAAHAAGIVHRDVKPSNILLTPTGQVKLSDFGIARTANDAALTQTGLVTGSPAYLSPEVASGQVATPASDVWSWGATMYHALEGRPPYDVGDNLLGALYRIVHEAPPRTSAAGWLAPALEGTLTQDPAARWAIRDARAFLEDGPGDARPLPVSSRYADPAGPQDGRTTVLPLHADKPPTPAQPMPAQPVTTQSPPPPVPPPAPVARPRKRRPWALVLALTALLAVAVVAAFWIGLRGGDEPESATSPPSRSATDAPATGSGEPSPSPSEPTPTAADMESFARTYVETASADPASGFAMLTPGFQDASNGYDGYLTFWGTVRSAEIDSVTADPDALTVRYTYTYRVQGEAPQTETVTLQLAFENGTYLIAGEA